MKSSVLELVKVKLTCAGEKVPRVKRIQIRQAQEKREVNTRNFKMDRKVKDEFR